MAASSAREHGNSSDSIIRSPKGNPGRSSVFDSISKKVKWRAKSAFPLPMAEAEQVGVSTKSTYQCIAEEFCDARITNREETLKIIEELVITFLEDISNGRCPEFRLIRRASKNVVRDKTGKVHLGGDKAVKSLFGRKGTGCKSFTKVWQVLSLVYRLLSEGKMATQREAYYCLVQNFKDQNEFNCILQDVVALTQCSRSSLGISASGSGYIAGLVLWKEDGSDPYDCSTSDSGKQIPGVINKVDFESLGARYILVVEKDAVFTYLCGQRIWNSLPCVLITGCGYPPLSVRAVTKKLADLLEVPVLGLFDYNPHGVRILLTYKFGSTRMGTESHAYAVDMKWLGVHYCDLFDESGEVKVAEESLQPWVASDARVFSSIHSSIESLNTDCLFYMRELRLMERKKVKAEIEALNQEDFNSLERVIIHKTLHRLYL